MRTALIALVAALHLSFLVLEMVLWKTKIGMKIFGLTPQTAEITSVLAKNQGLYNGFLAAGLIWSFTLPNPEFQHAVQTFFLVCVAIAGIYGAMTVKPSVFFVQALPAILALFL
jgi:putative membrane protein